MLIKHPTLWRPPINLGFITDWRTFRTGPSLVFYVFFFFSLAHIFTAQQYESECTVTINIIYNPQAAFQSSMKSTSYKHTLSACCFSFLQAGSLWKGSGWISRYQAASFPQVLLHLVCWSAGHPVQWHQPSAGCILLAINACLSCASTSAYWSTRLFS